MYEYIFSLLDIEEIERGNSTSKWGFCRDVGMKKILLVPQSIARLGLEV